MISIGVTQVPLYAFQGATGYLSAAGIIQVDGGFFQGGELLANKGNIQAHRWSPWLSRRAISSAR
jgi:hypothetical protein